MTLASTSSNLPVSSNLPRAISDVHYVSHGGLFKPDYVDLLKKLQELEQSKVLPKNYISGVLRPFMKFLMDELDEKKFNDIFQTDLRDLASEQRFYRKIIPDIAEALLQRNYKDVYYPSSYNDLLAFQAVVTSIYQTILDKKIQTVSKAILPPLAKWGKGGGPYTWTVQSTNKSPIGLYAGIVNLPIENRNGGLLAWSTLGHEVAGHNFLCSHKDLLPELESAVFDAIKKEGHPSLLANYWARCVEETTSDILGVLNIGPVSAIALIGYFRGMRGGKMQTEGIFPLGREKASRTLVLYPNPKVFPSLTVRDLPDYVKLPKEGGLLGRTNEAEIIFESYFMENGRHPVDVLRPFALLEVLDQMTSRDLTIKKKWSDLRDLIEVEAYADLNGTQTINVTEIDAQKDTPSKIVHPFPSDLACNLGKIAAKAIITSSLKCLGGKKLIDIFSWTDLDEMIVDEFKEAMSKNNSKFVSRKLKKNTFHARYIVAAATQASLETGADIEAIFKQMKVFLLEAYNQSKTWKQGDNVLVKLNLENDISLEPRHFFGK